MPFPAAGAAPAAQPPRPTGDRCGLAEGEASATEAEAVATPTDDAAETPVQGTATPSGAGADDRRRPAERTGASTDGDLISEPRHGAARRVWG